MTLYNIQQSKNHEKSRQKQLIIPIIPKMGLKVDRLLDKIKHLSEFFIEFVVKIGVYR